MAGRWRDKAENTAPDGSSRSKGTATPRGAATWSEETMLDQLEIVVELK